MTTSLSAASSEAKVFFSRRSKENLAWGEKSKVTEAFFLYCFIVFCPEQTVIARSAESLCMVVVYVPKYEHHEYCRREYRAMEILEERRTRICGKEKLADKGMIFPIILRGDKDLPDKIKRVLCRNLTEPAISAGLAFPAKLSTVAVAAVEMWEPAFDAGFQAPWDGQQSFGKDLRHRSHGASFPQRTRNSAHFGANVVVKCCARPKLLFSESRVERPVLQIVVQSHKK